MRPQYLWPIPAAILLWANPAFADHPGQSRPFPHISHLEVPSVVTKIHPSMVFVQPAYGLQFRTLSAIKAERIGLSDLKVGEMLTLVVDEGNILIDAHKPDAPRHGHRLIVGDLHYADQSWQEIQLATPEGPARFDVDSLAGSKLSVLQEGSPVEVELDEANVVIDVHRVR